MNHPDSQGRHELLRQMYAFDTLRPAITEASTQAERDQWQEWLRSPSVLKSVLNRVINLENELSGLRAKAAAWDHLAGIADHSAVSDVELSGDMNGPNKWIAIAGLLEGSFIEGLQAATPEQAVQNLSETFKEWHRDTFESCLEDG
jgi:hypothetical protein